jgi:RNA polymerase sigma-70 factor (ECF subfamily)
MVGYFTDVIEPLARPRRALDPMRAACKRPQPVTADPRRAHSRHFAEAILPHEPTLFSAALRLCGNQAEAHDLVQDTFERALRNFDGFQPGTNARGWLLTIVHHLFIDRCRRRRREPLQLGDQQDEVAQPEEPMRPPPVWEDISREQLLAAVEQLSDDFRTVYKMHDLEGRSYNDIVERLGIPKATVGTRLARARRKLRVMLAPRTAPTVDEE